MVSRRAASEIATAGIRILNAGGHRRTRCAGGKPGVCRLAWPALAPVSAEVRMRAGPFPKRRARRSKAKGLAGPSASTAPFRFPGGVAGSPRRRGSRCRLSAAAQGKAFPMPSPTKKGDPALGRPLRRGARDKECIEHFGSRRVPSECCPNAIVSRRQFDERVASKIDAAADWRRISSEFPIGAVRSRPRGEGEGAPAPSAPPSARARGQARRRSGHSSSLAPAPRDDFTVRGGEARQRLPHDLRRYPVGSIVHACMLRRTCVPAHSQKWGIASELHIAPSSAVRVRSPGLRSDDASRAGA